MPYSTYESTAAPSAPDWHTEYAIRESAYQLWEQAGRPEGHASVGQLLVRAFLAAGRSRAHQISRNAWDPTQFGSIWKNTAGHLTRMGRTRVHKQLARRSRPHQFQTHRRNHPRCQSFSSCDPLISNQLWPRACRRHHQSHAPHQLWHRRAYLVPFLQRGELRLIAEATPEELDTCRRLLPSLVDACQILTIPPLTRPSRPSPPSNRSPESKPRIHACFSNPPPSPSPSVSSTASNPTSPCPAPPSISSPNSSTRSSPARNHAWMTAPSSTPSPARAASPTGSSTTNSPSRAKKSSPTSAAKSSARTPPAPAAADVILTFKAGIHDPHRPLAVLFFAGPTGVGKTELAKALSRYLFGHGGEANRLVRLDMSEYAGPGARRSPPRTPPHGEPSSFIQRIRQQPFSGRPPG